jgi:hypothetical protein
MCDIFGTGGAAKKMAEETAKQANATREATRVAAEEERAYQSKQTAQTRALEAERYSEQSRIQSSMQAAAAAEAARIQEAEVRRQQGIAEGQGIISDMFGQFNDQFYSDRSKSYVDYATPQLDTQYQQGMQALVRSLSRSGNLNSSVRGQSMADMKQQYDKGMLSIADQGNQYANQARSAIEQSRNSLLGQNAQLADPGAIRSMTAASVGNLNSSPAYSPLQTLITALTSSAGTDSTTGATAGSGEASGVNLFGSTSGTATGTSVV